MDFVLRCAEHKVLEIYPNTGLEYRYRINIDASTREQRERKDHGLSGEYKDSECSCILMFCKEVD